ncbi:MAG: sigma 54-interacting transcriptional regulator [Deltaproteobacteria bacterium]|nr:sigma 54-interacting transcriptional regulator [Deltaproteobacteria bacterium]
MLPPDEPERTEPTSPPMEWALVVIWCDAEPERLGEVMAMPKGQSTVAELGRGPGHPSGPPRLEPVRPRPGVDEPALPLGLRGVSRSQLRLRRRSAGGLAVENIGRCALLVNGAVQREANVGAGDVLELRQQIAWLCVRRPRPLPPVRDFPMARHLRFGHADALHLVGESPAAWELRERIAFSSAREGHVLVLGESGTGKELAARGIHVLSNRGRNRLVSRSAATLPEGLIDAELFGNAANYPNPGMKERPGLIGQADGGTLFLDEIGELPGPLQTHLLRVLDSDGEYQRLGEAKSRRSNLRFVAATNRPLTDLKDDFGARFPLRLRVPSLDERREDIPLLARHLLLGIAREDSTLRERFFDTTTEGVSTPRLDPALITALVRHDYSLNIRELLAALWSALASSTGDRILLTPEVEIAAPETDEREQSYVKPDQLDPAAVQAVLDANDGMQEKAWRELGLKNRFVLIRYIRKHGLVVKRSE